MNCTKNPADFIFGILQGKSVYYIQRQEHETDWFNEGFGRHCSEGLDPTKGSYQ